MNCTCKLSCKIYRTLLYTAQIRNFAKNIFSEMFPKTQFQAYPVTVSRMHSMSFTFKGQLHPKILIAYTKHYPLWRADICNQLLWQLTTYQSFSNTHLLFEIRSPSSGCFSDNFFFIFLEKLMQNNYSGLF